MRRRIDLSRAVGAALLLVACGSAPFAAQEAFFEEGNRLYQEGDFAGAVELYERILESGVESGELHYNLGNAWFRLGEIGPAVLHYERARRMMPRDDDLRANLELARSLTVDEITPLPGFWLLRVARWWVDLLSRPVLLAVVTLAWLTAMGALIVAVAGRAESLVAWSRRVAAAARRLDARPRPEPHGARARCGPARRGGYHGGGGGGAQRAVRRSGVADLHRARGDPGAGRAAQRRVGRDRPGRRQGRMGAQRPARAHLIERRKKELGQ